jgi:hypothetical protein
VAPSANGHEGNGALLSRWLRARAAGQDGRDLPRGREIERVVRDLKKWRPEAHAALKRCYLGRDADPTLPERWQEAGGPEARVDLHRLKSAMTFILYALAPDRGGRGRS